MTTIYEKARELGNSLLETQEADLLLAARAAYFENKEAVDLMASYEKMENDIRKKMQSGDFSADDFEASKNRLAEYGKVLQKNKIISQLISCQESFNKILDEIITIINAQVNGDFNSECCSGGGCNGCSGCH